MLLSPSTFRLLVYEQDEQPAHPRGLERGSTLKWPPASLFAQLLGRTKTEGNGINQEGSCPWKKNRKTLVRKSQPNKVQIERIFFFSVFHMVECCLVTNIFYQATTVFYDIFDSVGDHLEKNIIKCLMFFFISFNFTF